MGLKSIDATDTRSSHILNFLFLVNPQTQMLLNLIRILPM